VVYNAESKATQEGGGVLECSGASCSLWRARTVSHSSHHHITLMFARTCIVILAVKSENLKPSSRQVWIETFWQCYRFTCYLRARFCGRNTSSQRLDTVKMVIASEFLQISCYFTCISVVGIVVEHMDMLAEFKEWK